MKTCVLRLFVNRFSFGQRLPWLCAFFAGLAGFSANAEIATWEFNDQAGNGITQAVNSASDVAFDGGATGVRTNGEGRLEIRRPLRTSITRYAAIDPVASGKIWMQIDIDGWDLDGDPTEELSFGFYGGEEGEDAAAVLEWKHLTPANVWIWGRAEGDGATEAAVDELLPPTQLEAISYVLECDLDQDTYEIYRTTEDGAWLSVGRGAMAEGTEVSQFGMRFSNRFQDTPEEYFHIDRFSVTREDPIDRAQWTSMAEHPYVTAWSWAVADAETGEIVAGHAVDTPRKSASITKAMTTYVVCEMAKENPAILDEMVMFSELALTARGSSAHIEEGESLPLREALFAFMLPSGNAVGNAIAEHFRDRLSPPEAAEPGEELDPRANFIAEMNRTARKLGMTQTIYRSAFGDGGSSDDRTTTARDLIVLARAAMQNELFREVVGTKEYSTEITVADGSTRVGSWTNTNQFLGQEGFNGIKTGTTRTARACLLTSSVLNGRSLYAVVLGSNHSRRRYVDSRNLLNWAAMLE